MKPLKEQHLRPERPGPAVGVGSQGPPRSPPFFSPAASHALVLLPAGPGRARGCCCHGPHTLAFYNFPTLRGDQRPPVQKQMSARKSNNPGKRSWICFASRDFSPRTSSRGSVLPDHLRRWEQAAGKSGNLSRVHVCAPRPDLLRRGRARGDCVPVARQQPWVLPASVPFR